MQQYGHLVQLLRGTLQSGLPHLVEQRIDVRDRPRHLVRHHIGRIGGVAQQVGLLRTQADEVVDELFVIVLVTVVATVQIGLVELLAQRPLRRIGQERDEAGLVEREDPLAAAAQLVGLLAGGIAHTGRESVEVGLVRNLEREVVVLGQQIVAETDCHARQLLVDLLQPLLLLPFEQCAAAHETVVGLLQQPALLGIEPERLAPVIDLLDTGKQRLVEQDAVGMGREHR